MDFRNNKISSKELARLKKSADFARGAILKMTTLANSGHPGGSMSAVDYLLTLYHLINIDPKNPRWEERDRIVVSNGHISPAVYTVLGMMNFFDLKDAISLFRLAGSIFEGHIEPEVPGVEWATGNLGQGLSAGVGFALACRQKRISNNIFVLMGDGEQQKGQLSEARRFAAKYDLNNITAFVDYNKLQISGKIGKVMPQNIRDNYISDGWQVIEIDGHNFSQIQNAIFEAVNSPKPVLILANTIMGKGVSFMENKEKYHGSVLSEEQLKIALSELGLKYDLEKYKQLRADFVPTERKHKPEKIFPLNTGKPFVYTEKTDNRSAWGKAIANIAAVNSKTEMKNRLAVFDCDLKGSVKTGEFAEELPANFYESGIMEHHTAVMSGAMSKEGIQVFFVDFGVFGVDETYNQHRLNDINETNLKVITTHVGLDVGEDGKTHQCIDYLGVMKNLYRFRVLIPADANQTDRIIRYISGKTGNYLVAMGRSKLEVIKEKSGKIFFDEDYQFIYGKADLLREGKDAALLVMGTLVGRAVQIADNLAEKGISLQVWSFSCPSELDEVALKKAAQTGTIFTYEDHNVQTGLGNSVADKLLQMEIFVKFVKFGVEDYAFSGNANDVFKACRLDVDSITDRILETIK